MKVEDYCNYNLSDIVTPVKVDELERLLKETKYDTSETEYLIQGFRNGFSLEYCRPRERKSQSKNIPFRRIGDKFELWQKIMKEVKLGRYVGPFEQIPYEFYIQSPIGLVPKDGGRQTRLIFHLSYDFSENKETDGSLNYFTPKEKCSVRYNDLDYAIKTCLKFSDTFFMAKTNLRSAFHGLPILPSQYHLLIMQALHHIMG